MENQPPEPMAGAEWDMSAPISAEDIAKAGGLGARDGLGSAVPVAADNTDFEETLMEFGETKEISHEGVGYSGTSEGAERADGGGPGGHSTGAGDAILDEGMSDPNYLAHHFTKPVEEPTE